MMVCLCVDFFFFFFKQKPAYEMRISDWSSDVCSSDLSAATTARSCSGPPDVPRRTATIEGIGFWTDGLPSWQAARDFIAGGAPLADTPRRPSPRLLAPNERRSEEHTSELQSLMRISYAVFCLKKKNK